MESKRNVRSESPHNAVWWASSAVLKLDLALIIFCLANKEPNGTLIYLWNKLTKTLLNHSSFSLLSSLTENKMQMHMCYSELILF